MRTCWRLTKGSLSPLDAVEIVEKQKRRELRGYKFFAAVGCAGFLLTLAGLLYQRTLPQTIPLVITVSDWGEAKYVGDVSSYSYSGMKIPKAATEYQIRKFVSNIFSVPADAAVLRSNLKDCYSCLTGVSSQKLSTMLRENNPFDLFGTYIVTVEIESILNVSASSYQVDFIVYKSTPDLRRTERQRMRGVITIKYMAPSDEDIRQNPLGIYITQFDFTGIQQVKEEQQ